MSDLSLKPEIGALLELESLANDDLSGLEAEITGVEANKCLSITHPLQNSELAAVNPGDKFFICVTQAGSKVTFESEILEIQQTPGPQVRMSFPENVRPGTLRKSNRVPAAPADLRLPGSNDSDDTTVTMLNISCSGACLASNKVLGTIDQQFELEIKAQNSDTPVIIDCMIRHIQTDKEKDQPLYKHGVVFFGMDAEQQLFIWKYFQESALA